MQNKKNDWWISWNGRIYQTREPLGLRAYVGSYVRQTI